MEQTASTLKVYRISKKRIVWSTLLALFAIFIISIPILYIIAVLANRGEIVLFSFMIFAMGPPMVATQSTVFVEARKIILSETAISGQTLIYKKPFSFSVHQKGFKLSNIEKIVKKGIFLKRLLIYSDKGERIVVETSLFNKNDQAEILQKLNIEKHLTI